VSLVIAAALLSACTWTSREQAEREASGRKMQEALTKQTATNQELEGKLAALRLLLLEKDAKNRELDRKLDEAILEVVRTKAKLRSLESKAQAVSTLAEAEIALKALKADAVGMDKDGGVLQAEGLLKASVAELNKENYGGALYLATQAKSIINEGRERSTGRENTALAAGEVPFALPIPLRLVSSAKLREGPGLDYKALATLPASVRLVGHSYKGLWVRVSTEDRQSGWIYHNLIDGR
jgi:uncharacterized protein YgiM (DUF1202 family)